MLQLDLHPGTLQALLREIGLLNSQGDLYAARVRKYAQIGSYIWQIASVLNKLSKKRPLVFLDNCCGKSYLSFVLYAYCTEVLRREVKVIGIDRNADLIAKCTASAQALGFESMHFYAADAGSFTVDERIDVAYSLHACDLATDYALAQAVYSEALYIFSVSCCQHTNRGKLAGHPLIAASRFGAYKERLTDMLGDSMRALVLEQHGYRVDLFEFAPAAQTPKNIMLRAKRGAVKRQDREAASERLEHLSKLFGFSPEVANII